MGNFEFTGYGHYHECYVRCPDAQWRVATQTLTRLHMDYIPARGFGTATVTCRPAVGVVMIILN